MGGTSSKEIATASDTSTTNDDAAEAQDASTDGQQAMNDWRSNDNSAPDATEMKKLGYSAPPRALAIASEMDSWSDDDDFENPPLQTNNQGTVQFTVPPNPEMRIARVLYPAALRRARNRAIAGIAGCIGIVVAVTATGAALWATGFLHFGKKVDCTPTALPDPQPGDDDMEKMLMIWAQMPEDKFWAYMESQAFASGKEWGAMVWAEVTRFLSAVTGYMLGEIPSESKTNATLTGALVPDKTLQADYADWNVTGKLAPRYIFDKSASYPAAGSTLPNTLYNRAVRLNYLSRQFDRAVSEMVISQTGGGGAGIRT